MALDSADYDVLERIAKALERISQTLRDNASYKR